MKNLVTFGGGTGSYALLSGIKNIPDIELSAIVAMTDDGGSTGVLRDELGVLPPGDVRQCIVALSEETDTVRKLMSYRFEEGTLSGHSFGNIFLAGLEKVTGSFVAGVEVASKILKVKGRVIPVTDTKATLEVLFFNGGILVGEDQINKSDIQKQKVLELRIKDAKLNPHAKEVIDNADYIIIGPGNHYCSVLPNLVVSGCKEALQTTRAKIIYIVNLTNKKGHTHAWNVSNYVTDIENYIGRKLDYILINNETPSEEQVHAYELKEGDGVMVKNDMLNDIRIIEKNLISKAIIVNNKTDKGASLRSFIRHDHKLLEETISRIII